MTTVAQQESTVFRILSRTIAFGIITLTVLLSSCSRKVATAAPPPTEVEVTQVVQKDVPLYGEWVTTLDGYVNADIRPQVTGYLLKQNYREGTMVRKGEVLFEIDPRPFEAVLQQAKGQLAEAQAQLSKTSLDVKRDTPLAAQSAIPQAQLDNDLQARAAAEALVASATAQVDQAKLNLEFTRVRSLIDGLAGVAKTQVGDLVGPTSILTTVSQINPIKAYIAIGEQEYLSVAPAISAVAQGKRIEAEPKRLELMLADGSSYSEKGRFVFADRQVDVKTGTIRIAGAFDNPQGILRPGQFGRIRVRTGTAKDALLVPQKSVIEIQGTYQVVTVGADNKAVVRPVKVGERIGQMWIVTEGIKPGERVVVEGLQKAREGTIVAPKEVNLEARGE